MNFFGHYVTDGIDGDHWYNFGLVFPDLFRDLYKGSFPSFLETQKELSPAFESFAKGISKHHELDAFFHNSAFFKDAEVFVKETLALFHGLKSLPRQWFFIHIVVELITDRVLVVKYPQLAKNMYDDFRMVLMDAPLFLLLFPEDEVRLVFSNRLDRIQKDNYIFAYTNTSKLMHTIGHIYRKAGVKLSEDQLNNLANEFVTFVSTLENDERLHWKSLSTQLT